MWLSADDEMSAVSALVRPEHLLLSPGGDGDAGWPGVVRVVSYLGSVARYEVAVAGQADVIVDVPAPRGSALLPLGSSVKLALREGRGYLPTDQDSVAGGAG